MLQMKEPDEPADLVAWSRNSCDRSQKEQPGEKGEVRLRRQGRLSGKKERNPGNNRQPKTVSPRNITQKRGIYRNDNKVKVKI